MMLDRLDTAIAFAVILLGVSLLITILTQMASALLGLRGTHLLWGVKTLLATLDPRLEGEAEELAHRVLLHPLISDSTFSCFDKVPWVGAMSRRWRLATSVRPEELAGTLRMIAGSCTPATAAAIQAVLDAREPEADRRIKMLAAAAGAVAPAWTGSIDRVLEQAADASLQSAARLETWFTTTMDRVSQRFALQMRLWTVLFAFVAAFGAHLDALQMLQRLDNSPQLRNALVDSRDSMLRQAEGLQQASTSPETVEDLKKRADAINASLAQSNFQLLPDPYPRKLWESRRNLLGMLITAAFLSLGAPFWYNVLKGLGNLRPVPAENANKEAGKG